MDFINDNLQILATLGSALAVYAFIRLGARKEVNELRKELNESKTELKSEITQLKSDITQHRAETREGFKEVQEDLKQIDRRLTRLEGRFDERGYWESREHFRTGTEDKN